MNQSEADECRALFGGMARHMQSDLEKLHAAIQEKVRDFRLQNAAEYPKRLIIGTSENERLRQAFQRTSRLMEICGRERRQYLGMHVFVVDAATFLEVLP